MERQKSRKATPDMFANIVYLVPLMFNIVASKNEFSQVN